MQELYSDIRQNVQKIKVILTTELDYIRNNSFEEREARLFDILKFLILIVKT
jgi:hypothetical protein